ncbi:MAG: helix-turn-helix protein [Treponematales bacterium]
MIMARKFRSRIAKHVFETAKDLYEIGAITAEQLWEFEEDCVLPETGGAVRGVSIPVAAYAAHGTRPGYSHAG